MSCRTRSNEELHMSLITTFFSYISSARHSFLRGGSVAPTYESTQAHDDQANSTGALRTKLLRFQLLHHAIPNPSYSMQFLIYSRSHTLNLLPTHVILVVVTMWLDIHTRMMDTSFSNACHSFQRWQAPATYIRVQLLLHLQRYNYAKTGI